MKTKIIISVAMLVLATLLSKVVRWLNADTKKGCTTIGLTHHDVSVPRFRKTWIKPVTFA